MPRTPGQPNTNRQTNITLAHRLMIRDPSGNGDTICWGEVSLSDPTFIAALKGVLGLTDGVVTPPSPSFELALPAGLSAVYAMQRVAGYSGPAVRVIPSNGTGTPQDIGFNADGSFDTTTLDGLTQPVRVTTVYDQSGAGLHATQATISAMPLLNKAGRIRGKQSISFLNGSYFLSLPAGLVADRRNATVLDVCAPWSVSSTQTPWELGTGTGNNRVSFAMNQDNNFQWQMVDGTLANYSGNPLNPRSQTQFHANTLTAASTIGQADADTLTKGSALNAGSTAGGFIGKSDLNSQFVFTGGVFMVAIYGATQLAAEMVQSARASAEAIFDVAVSPKQIVWEGDSISFGTGSNTGTIAVPTLPDTFLLNLPRQTEAALNQRVDIINLGVFGQKITSMYTSRARVTARFKAAKTKNIVHVLGGTNDLENAASGSILGIGNTIWNGGSTAGLATDPSAPVTPGTVIGLLGMIRAYKAAGFVVKVGTLLARNFGGSTTDRAQKESERVAYNTLIRNKAAAEDYEVVDYAGITQFGASGAVSTTYLPDGTHPSSAGYALMAAMAAPVLQSAL